MKSPAQTRTPERLRVHYEAEKDLADRLRRSRKEDRAKLYAIAYNELFQRVPDHPQLTRIQDPDEIRRRVDERMKLLEGLIDAGTVFLEMGAGDCRLSLEAAKRVRHVFAVDVSDQITAGIVPPPNFTLILSDGTSIDIDANTITIAYSHQLMEHIHPDDALEQVRNIYQVLAPGGKYICITPNALAGPHDISRLYSTRAQGLHLKEYTIAELNTIFRAAGFRSVRTRIGCGGVYLTCPSWPARVLEYAISLLPSWGRRRVCVLPGIRHCVFAAIVAEK